MARESQLPNPEAFLRLRHRIVGARLRQLRQEKELELRDIDPAVTAWLDEGYRLGLGAREIDLVEIVRG